MPGRISASLHSALERFGLLAALAALAHLLGLDSWLLSTRMVILVVSVILTISTRASLIKSPYRRNLRRLRILAASTVERLRNSYWHLTCTTVAVTIFFLLFPPILLRTEMSFRQYLNKEPWIKECPLCCRVT
jgi:hypothetical protein